MKISGNTILITGGATGIGYELAKQFLEENEVIICGRRENRLLEAQKNLPDYTSKYVMWQIKMTEWNYLIGLLTILVT